MTGARMKIEALTLTASCKLGEALITVVRTRNGKPPVATLQRTGSVSSIEADLIFGTTLNGFSEEENRVAFALSDSLAVVAQSLANSETMFREIDLARERRSSDRPHLGRS